MRHTMLTLVAAVAVSAVAPGVLMAAEPVQIQPTDVDRIVAWAVKGALAALLGILMPLLIVGAVRRSPMQDWMLPNADELRAAAALKAKLAEGTPLTAAESQIMAGLAVRSGLTVLAVMVFAGLLVLRL